MVRDTSFTVFYGAVLLRDGAIKTSILAERNSYDALVSLKEEHTAGTWESIAVYTSDPVCAAYDGDTRHGPLLGQAVRSTYFPETIAGRAPPPPPITFNVPGGKPYNALPIKHSTPATCIGACS